MEPYGTVHTTGRAASRRLPGLGSPHAGDMIEA